MRKQSELDGLNRDTNLGGQGKGMSGSSCGVVKNDQNILCELLKETVSKQIN